MHIKKRINNNVILATDNQQDCILIGKGLGFKSYPGDTVDEQLVEQRFFPSDSFDVYTVAEMLCNASGEDVEMIREIIRFGEDTLGKKLNENLLFTLLDHLIFALGRYEKQMETRSPIEWEIKNMYRKETLIGEKALEIIKSYRGIQLPNSEVIFIAMHFINGQFESETMSDTLELAELMNKVSNIIKYSFQIELDPESMNYQRFLTHLRYYLLRQKNQETFDLGNEELYLTIQQKFPKESDCVDKIVAFIEKEYQFPTSMDEKLYLILHVNRLIH